MEEMNDRLKRLRKAAGLTQATLAAAAGLSQGTIGNIESGIRGYGESLVDIAKALGVPPEYLRGEASAYAASDQELPAISSTGKGRQIGPVSVELLKALGDALEATAPSDRDGAVAMLTTYIANPAGNADLLPLIVRRLAK